MKAIQLTTDIIAREQLRSVDRDNNTLTIYLSIEPKFGKAITATTRSKFGVFCYQLEKSRHATAWGKIKDMLNDNLIDEIKGQINEILPVLKKHRAEAATPTTREAIQETSSDGTTTYVYRDAGQAAFDAAKTRTGHSSVQVAQPNSQEAALNTLIAKYPVEEIDALLTHLIDMDVTTPLKTVAI